MTDLYEALRKADDRSWEDGRAMTWALDQWRRAVGAEAAQLRRLQGNASEGADSVSQAPDVDSEATEEAEVLCSSGAWVQQEPRKRRLSEDLELWWIGEDVGEGPLNEESLVLATTHLRSSRQRLRERAFQDNYRALAMEALYDVGLSIAATLNLEELSQQILLHAVSLLDARRGALYRVRGDTYLLQGTIGGSAAPSVPVDQSARGDGHEILPGSEYQLACAIDVEGHRRGLIVVGDKESRTGVGPFGEADERALSLFANQAAIALENAKLHRQALEKERLEREMELAAEIQRGLLPSRMPQIGDLEIAGWNRPTRQVGGDYYGAISLPDGRTLVVVADVTGKGMPAALLVSTLHTGLDLLFGSDGCPQEILAKLNQHIHDSTTANKFITLIMVMIEPGEQALHYLNAGHNPGLLVKADGTFERLQPCGLPLGLMAGSTYETADIDVDPGDLLCLFSDGITECEAPDGEEYGEERLVEFLRAHREADLGEIIRALDNEVTAFAEGAEQYDDQTVVLVRRAPAA